MVTPVVSFELVYVNTENHLLYTKQIVSKNQVWISCKLKNKHSKQIISKYSTSINSCVKGDTV